MWFPVGFPLHPPKQEYPQKETHPYIMHKAMDCGNETKFGHIRFRRLPQLPRPGSAERWPASGDDSLAGFRHSKPPEMGEKFNGHEMMHTMDGDSCPTLFEVPVKIRNQIGSSGIRRNCKWFLLVSICFHRATIQKGSLPSL